MHASTVSLGAPAWNVSQFLQGGLKVLGIVLGNMRICHVLDGKIETTLSYLSVRYKARARRWFA